MSTLVEFLSCYEESAIEHAVLGVFPSDSYIVCDEDQTLEDQRLYAVCQEISLWNDYSVHGFLVESSNDSVVFKITWPGDLVSSPWVYLITQSYTNG